jgi:two-component system, LytTR family, response regulator
MPLRALIVDDEPVARKVLREELDQIEDIDIVGEAEDGSVALRMIEQQHPDLVLLDLEMPVMGGFEVVRQLKRGAHLPVIVVVTAYDQHAIRAFEVGAVDYLLKPVGGDRLAQTVDRVRRLIHNAPEVAERLSKLQEIADSAPGAMNRKIVGREGEQYVLLNTEEVFAFQAEGDLVWIVTAKKRYLATQTLRALQTRLQGTSFRRIHRSALVNLNHVRRMSTLSSQRWLVTLTNNLEFVVSKRQATNVRELLSW